MMMPTAPTLTAVSTARATSDTLEMDSSVQVNKRRECLMSSKFCGNILDKLESKQFSSSSDYALLSPAISFSLFHSELKTYLF